MKRYFRLYLAALVGALLSTSAAAVPQVFVESTGADRNTRHDCTADRPCRTFAAAKGVVDNGGETVAREARTTASSRSRNRSPSSVAPTRESRSLRAAMG